MNAESESGAGDTKPAIHPLELSEDIYKADVEVLSRYQDFSAEVLRLSLAAIGGIAALVTLGDSPLITRDAPRFVTAFELFSIGLVGFSIAIGFSLLHRQASSDSLQRFIKALRDGNRGRADAAAEARKEQRFYFRLSAASISCAASFLFLGGTAAGLGLINLLVEVPFVINYVVVWLVVFGVLAVVSTVFMFWRADMPKGFHDRAKEIVAKLLPSKA